MAKRLQGHSHAEGLPPQRRLAGSPARCAVSDTSPGAQGAPLIGFATRPGAPVAPGRRRTLFRVLGSSLTWEDRRMVAGADAGANAAAAVVARLWVLRFLVSAPVAIIALVQTPWTPPRENVPLPLSAGTMPRNGMIDADSCQLELHDMHTLWRSGQRRTQMAPCCTTRAAQPPACWAPFSRLEWMLPH